ncbi:hypothetical protein V6N11_064709 [Hibiscus sabdariffa]|uniref:MULE transposase domain-containing protein n=1 Tax=Hibiscus sabdariffa TaxID=183260 RepID=A0ABR2NBC3_9ROSI
MEKIIDPDYICYPTIVAFIEEIGIPKQNIEYLSYLEPCLSLDGGLRNLGTENHNYLELIKHLENEGSAHIYVVGDFREIDEDEVRNNDVGPNIGEIEVVGPDGVENNEDGHVLGKNEVVGLVGVENNEDVHVLGETEATGVVGVENNDDGHVLGESEGVRPVLGERGDGDNEGSEKVGRYVNADSNDITTDTAKSDEDDDKAQPKCTATDSQRKESSVEDETSDIDYIESDDPGSYETDSEGELCVKKGKKLFFNDKGEVPRIELGMIFENSNSLRKLWVLMLWSNDLILDGVFRVRTYASKHSCSVTFKNRRANYRFVGKYFLSKLKILPNLKLKDMMRLAKDELKVELNKNMCQRARVWANQKIRGKLEDEFNKLFDYVYTLREADPNGTFDLFVQRPTPSANPIFRRLYVCFGGLKEGFNKHCRPILSLDGCYLKGDFKGEILATVGRDENNQIFPVTWAVVEVENRETWAWFLDHIQMDLEIGDGDRFTIFSDMQKSQQTQDSISLQPEATDVSQPPAPNPSQPATTDVSQPLAPNPSQPGTSQASQPQFPNSGNTSTKIKGKASC